MHGPLELIAAYKALAATNDVTYVLSADLRIVRTNAAWDQFARANGGEEHVANWGRGATLLDAIPEPLKEFYVDGFARARDTGERWEHDYECSSPELLRRFRMLVYPFGGSFLVTHSLLLAVPHGDAAVAPTDSHVEDGVITMCSHCRRVRRAGDGESWDWIPAYVRSMPPNLSHGLCPACVSYYYGAVHDDPREA